MKSSVSNVPTIFALASAPGRAGVAVLRISGPNARLALTKFCQTSIFAPRIATLSKITDATGTLIDRALVLYFAAPDSFTGEDVVEFHLHGGRAIIKAVINALQSLSNFRLAEPGEFTRRAFENGKMDLTEAEAIADLVDAETEAQRRQAVRQMEGELGRLYNQWGEQLKRILAHFEADIDFADEDLPADIATQHAMNIQKLLTEVTTHLDDAHRGERLRTGFTVAILGPPNAGKSSLLNALVQREAAIVSPTPGTTRDVIEVQLDLGGYPVTLADTAGLRASMDEIESEGIRRAHHRAEQADLKLLVFDGAAWPVMDEATCALIDENSIVVMNKIDLLAAVVPPSLIPISATTGAGLKELTTQLVEAIDLRFANTGQPCLTRARHRAALEETKQHLQRSLTASEAALRAEDVRLAMRALGRITGKVDVEDLLDVIFREFCIGK